MAEILTPSAAFLNYDPASENDFEALILQRASALFPKFVFLPVKAKLYSILGYTIPDAVAFRLSSDGEVRQWFLVEFELAIHPVLEHVSSQLQRFRAVEFNAENQRSLLEKSRHIPNAPSESILRQAMSEIRPDILLIVDRLTQRMQQALKHLSFGVFVTECRLFKSFDGQRALLVDGFRDSESSEELQVSLISPNPFCGVLRFRWIGKVPSVKVVTLQIGDEQFDGRLVKSRSSQELHLVYDAVVDRSPAILYKAGLFLRLKSAGVSGLYRLTDFL